MVAVAASAEEWETLVSDSFVPLTVNRFQPGEHGFNGRVCTRTIGAGGTVNRVTADGSTLRRDLRRTSPEDRGASLLFVVHHSGVGRVEQFERRSEQSPGDFVMYLSDTPYTLDFPGSMDELVIHVPLRSLTTPHKKLKDLCARTFAADAAVRATTAYAGALLEADDGSPVEHLASTISYMLDSALCGHLRVSAMSAPDDVLRTRAERYIEISALDGALSPDSVARALSVSRRRLYGLFENTPSSPAARIREARVRRALTMLTNNPHQPVTSLWAQTGFKDQRTFLRAFTSAIGVTPSEYRRNTLASQA